MLEVIVCSTRADMRAFFRLDQLIACGRSRTSVCPARIALDPARNPFLSGRRSRCFLALRDDRPVSRLVAVADGWFTLFETLDDADAAAALIAAAKRWVAECGASRLTGPLAPDGSGYGVGVLLPDGEMSAPWQPINEPWYAEHLRFAGLTEDICLLDYRFDIDRLRIPAHASGRICGRFGLTVTAIALNSREACRMAYAVSGGEGMPFERYARVFGSMSRLAGRGSVLLLASRKEVPIGFLLCARNGSRLRVLSAHVAVAERGGPCMAALIAFLAESVRGSGDQTLSVGFIDADNRPSRRLAENAGGLVCARYSVFTCHI